MHAFTSVQHSVNSAVENTIQKFVKLRFGTGNRRNIPDSSVGRAIDCRGGVMSCNYQSVTGSIPVREKFYILKKATFIARQQGMHDRSAFESKLQCYCIDELPYNTSPLRCRRAITISITSFNNSDVRIVPEVPNDHPNDLVNLDD